MKKLLLFTFLMASMVSLAQVNIPFENPSFDIGVGTTSWATNRVSVDSLTPIAAEVKEGWRVVSSSTWEGVFDIQSDSINTGSGALRIDSSAKGAFGGAAKLETSRHQFLTTADVSSFDITIAFSAFCGTQPNGSRPKTYINYKVGTDAYVNESFTNANGRFANNQTNFLAQGGTQTFTPAATIPSGTVVEFYLEFRFGGVELGPDQTSYLDDVSASIAGTDFTNVPLSTKDFSATALNVYPNPVKDILNITDQDVKTASVYNLVGQKVLESSVTNQLNVSSLAKGVYLVQFAKENVSGVITKKFIKN